MFCSVLFSFFVFEAVRSTGRAVAFLEVVDKKLDNVLMKLQWVMRIARMEKLLQDGVWRSCHLPSASEKKKKKKLPRGPKEHQCCCEKLNPYGVPAGVEG